jgi:hypothetical protein
MDPSSLSLHTAALFVCLFDDFVEPFEARRRCCFILKFDDFVEPFEAMPPFIGETLRLLVDRSLDRRLT